MKKYILMHKNKAILGFVVNNSDVENVTMSKRFLEFIPLPIKRAIRLNGYIESENSNIIILNEEGSFLLDTWLHDRAIPYNRDNMAKYIPSGIGNFNYMLNNFSVSLTDCYWTIELSEKNKGVNWDSIKYYNNKRIDRLDIIEQSRNKGNIYSGVNSTLGGMLEKYWFYTIKDNKKQLMLAKRTDLNNSILNIREVIASKIYELQGFKNYCQYKYIRNNSKQIVGVKCKAFTSENIELITVYDLLDEFNETKHSDVYSNIIKRASAYGADPCKVANQLDIQTLVDYLITNRDRHQNNIGF